MPWRENLFGQENPLGKQLYDTIGQPATVIGIVDPAMNSWPGSEHSDWVFYMPRAPPRSSAACATWCVPSPGQLNAMMRLAEDALSKSNPERVVHFVRPLGYFKDLSYLGDRSMGIYLLTVTVLLIAVTCLGIFALATFNVSTRTKQIGTRRAVGARRADIVQYFLVENGMITSAGILARLRAGARHGLLALGAVPAAAPESVLPRRRGAGALGDRPARRLAAGAACGRRAALGGDAHRLSSAARPERRGAVLASWP